MRAKLVYGALAPFQNFLAAPDPPKNYDDPIPPADEITGPIDHMLRSLKRRVEKHYPDAAKFAIFTLPDSLVTTSLFNRTRHALRLNKYGEYGGRNAGSSRLAISQYLKFAYVTDEPDFKLGKPARSLVVQHMDTALTLITITTEDGRYHEVAKTATFVKPPYTPKNAKQIEAYYKNVGRAIEQLITEQRDGKMYLDKDWDELVLLGDRANQTEFLDAVKEVFAIRGSGDERPKIRSLDPDEQVFAAARGAAAMARKGLDTAFYDCEPNPACPQPRSTQKSNEKSEL